MASNNGLAVFGVWVSSLIEAAAEYLRVMGEIPPTSTDAEQIKTYKVASKGYNDIKKALSADSDDELRWESIFIGLERGRRGGNNHSRR